ncbi:MAG TPA: hypothetical protein VHX49_14870, partial [Candidatus Acidoferrales bacterium]|nr:hypothetical protein [Candidatus Acidoferrales bacterium]
TVRLFHSLHPAGLPGAVCIALLEGGLLLPSKNTVLTHRMLALRHSTPERVLYGYFGSHMDTS